MASYRDIEEYRRKKRIKQLIRNIAAAVAILGVLLLVLWALGRFQGSSLDRYFSSQREGEADRFPLTVKTEQLLDLEAVGRNLAVLTRSSLMLYDENGEQLAVYAHGYTNPVVKTGDKHILTYDRGGSKLRVHTSLGNVSEITTDSLILTAEISEKGRVAVATSYRANVYNILVYDEDLSLLFRKMTTEDYTAMAFDDDEVHVALGSVFSPDGILSTELSILNRTDETAVDTVSVEDMLPVKIGYLSDDLIVAGKDSAVFVDLPSGKQSRITYPGQLQRMEFLPEEVMLLVNENPFSSYSTLTAITGGQKTKTAELTADVLDLSCSGERIGLLSKNSVIYYDMSLNKLGEQALSQSVQKLVLIGDNAYLMGDEQIEKLALPIG